MLVSSSLESSVPSLSLLRFLRSQTDSVFFFTANPTTKRSSRCSTSPTGNSPWHHRRGRTSVQRASSWTRLDAVPCQARIEASLFSLLTPTSLSKRLKSPLRLRLPSSSSSASQALKLNDVVLSSRLPLMRNASTKSRGWLRNWPFPPGIRQAIKDEMTKWKSANSPQVTSFTDDGAEGNLFNLGRTLASKSLNEPRLRCTEFDENGNVTLVNGEFRKSELIAKYGLLPRDLRKIDSSVLPHILIRPGAMLISLLHLRVLIRSDRVLVFDAYGSTNSYTQSVFMYDLEGKLQQRQSQTAGALPYEFRALESVLISVTSALESEFEGVREPVVRVLRALEEDIDRDKLRHLLVYSKKLGSFEQKARLVRDAIDDLLDADDDLAAMYLTEQAKGLRREETDHQDVEMLLESYDKVCDEIVQASGNLVTAIRNTEEVVKAILDANRNSLMLLDLKFSIGTLGIAVGTLVSALYGMNLKNFIEESDLGFGAVSATCFFFSIVVSMYGLAKLRKVQRVRMWGEGGMGPSGLGHLEPGRLAWSKHSRWRTDGLEPILNGPPQDKVYMRMNRLKDNTVDPRHASSPDAARRAVVTRSNDQQSSRQPDSKTNSNDQPAVRTEEEVAAKAS